MAVVGFQPMLNSNRIGHIMVAPLTRRHNLVAPFWRQLSTSKFMDYFCLVATTPGTMTSARVARLTSKQTCCYHPLPRMPSLGYCLGTMKGCLLTSGGHCHNQSMCVCVLIKRCGKAYNKPTIWGGLKSYP